MIKISIKSIIFLYVFLCSQHLVFAQNAIEKFDIKVSINFSVSSELLDVGIFKEDESNGDIKKTYFKMSELKSFFDRLGAKNVIYVELYFMDLSRSDQEKYLDRLVDYFKERGFNRVVIAHNRMVGPLILKDIQFKLH